MSHRDRTHLSVYISTTDNLDYRCLPCDCKFSRQSILETNNGDDGKVVSVISSSRLIISIKAGIWQAAIAGRIKIYRRPLLDEYRKVKPDLRAAYSLGSNHRATQRPKQDKVSLRASRVVGTRETNITKLTPTRLRVVLVFLSSICARPKSATLTAPIGPKQD
jgi:hypothetical protein